MLSKSRSFLAAASAAALVSFSGEKKGKVGEARDDELACKKIRRWTSEFFRKKRKGKEKEFKRLEKRGIHLEKEHHHRKKE